MVMTGSPHAVAGRLLNRSQRGLATRTSPDTPEMKGTDRCGDANRNHAGIRMHLLVIAA